MAAHVEAIRSKLLLISRSNPNLHDIGEPMNTA